MSLIRAELGWICHMPSIILQKVVNVRVGVHPTAALRMRATELTVNAFVWGDARGRRAGVILQQAPSTESFAAIARCPLFKA